MIKNKNIVFFISFKVSYLVPILFYQFFFKKIDKIVSEIAFSLNLKSIEIISKQIHWMYDAFSEIEMKSLTYFKMGIQKTL